ncbi:MAG: carbamoyl phosphate synthase large subunit [Chloroflexi bacterium GWB2_49_20]|nr:MAG: carbamoyl phosphate synthase large subunit [Chloroflexi bacterium GWB2_49_20]OGN77758.1 MAG: carbamoyl phosphate synthase large subunit [Chloroflexi bacterium GWC2_49_37]OGN86533.1 MAG: carbamoyl phosphate synthase large subunit [Chloroflexi bacterium GWD2_49_16]HBG74787.1 carbamoyl phosphate synthase large subunit [Anaerolineae bacterium]
MAKRSDIRTILVPGSGAIVIGQAAEFDYSGTQAVKALRKEGYRVVLVNSNPATIMTDPDIADATYIEPLTPDALEAIIAQEKPDAMLPTVGGQTGLNLALALSENGVLEKYDVQLIGANLHAIQTAENRQLFRETMQKAGIPVPHGGAAYSLAEAEALIEEIGYPVLMRASFALGGTGASWVYSPAELPEAVRKATSESPIRQVYIEESILGWKEYELEVMRDKADNFVVICTIENIDSMGVHTGDSITVAPAQTLTDREYQILRDLAHRVLSAVGIETGGSNVQFAIDPSSGHVVVIEMNPRVSRSSALASKATGIPIAKLAALVAVGYTLDEITNDITKQSKAAFEPSLDYVVVKIPRWAFEKFPGVDPTLGPQMKSVGEVMALGRTFQEALNKAVQSLETGVDALDGSGSTCSQTTAQENLITLKVPTADRLFRVYCAIRQEIPLQEISLAAGYDLWFLAEMQEIARMERVITECGIHNVEFKSILQEAKRMGFADSQIGRILGKSASEIRETRKNFGILPTFQRVDTCAAEFESQTPYLYSAYEMEDESRPTDKQKILILGGGPNRIGQGIEFDYCCCQAAFALSHMGYETIMYNCNPETVSTDYDTADRLYFEPLTLEHVLNVVDREQPVGVIVQFGGQTPLNLSAGLEAAGVKILGTSPHAIQMSEDREKFARLLSQLEIPQPENGIARSLKEARVVADSIGYPVLVRPSFVLGGRAMALVESETHLDGFIQKAIEAVPGQPILIDKFMEDAFEIDVDALADGERVVIGAVMQHIEEAGVHSGDSACVLPPYKVSAFHLGIMREYTEQLGLALKVRGLMNVQFALKDELVYVLEVNPRASRTIPYASKSTGLNLAYIAAQVMAGCTLAQLGVTDEPRVNGFFVKEAVLPFKKLPGSSILLGPEMRSTGEVLGHAAHFGHAFAKSQIAAGTGLPQSGAVLISVNDYDKSAGMKIARDLHRLGFKLYATPGTAAFFNKVSLPVEAINKITDGSPHTVDLIRNGKVQMVINTPLGSLARTDGADIRSVAVEMDIPLLTTLSAAAAAVAAIKALQQKELHYRSLQSHFSK